MKFFTPTSEKKDFNACYTPKIPTVPPHEPSRQDKYPAARI